MGRYCIVSGWLADGGSKECWPACFLPHGRLAGWPSGWHPQLAGCYCTLIRQTLALVTSDADPRSLSLHTFTFCIRDESNRYTGSG